MSDIIVTGGAGLQGSRLAKRLSELGHSVTVIDDCQRGCWANLDGAPKVKRTISDLRYTTWNAEEFAGAETVFHLAAHLGGVEYIKARDQQVMLDNLRIDANVIQASLDAKVKRLIFPSTACVYPVSKQREWDSVLKEEDAFFPVSPESGYGWAKLTAEVQLSKIESMDVGLMRLFNVYGPGEDTTPGSHAVPEVIRKVLFDRKPVILGDGSAGRCFLYADDAVEAYLAVMEKGCVGRPINIGSPDPIRIRDFVDMVMRISGQDKKVEYDWTAPEGVKGRVPDISFAKRLLGWEPKVTLEEGLPPTIDYVRSQRPLAAIR